MVASTSSLATAASLLVICRTLSTEAFSCPNPSATSNLFRPHHHHQYSSSSSSVLRQPTNTNNIISSSRSFFQSISTQRRRRLNSSSEDDLSFSSFDSAFAATTATTTTTEAVNGQDDLTKLKAENRLLNERIKLLQSQNDELLKKQLQRGEKNKPLYEQRLILEDFEGWPIPSVDARGGIVDGWNKREKRYTDELLTGGGGSVGAGDGTSIGDDTTTYAAAAVEDDDELGLVSSGLDEDELCEYDDQSNKWTSGIGECPLEPNITFLDAMKSRAYWLVGLLALQSCSGFILSRNELLLQDHPVIVYFLTMLVGAGGNAGNQASVRVIRGLALGTLNPSTQSQFLSRELRMAFALSSILSIAGFARAIIFQTPFPETMAVTLALSMIVFSSICLGAVLPLVLQKMGVDPAHSSTTIQVIMDILGVVLTVFVSTAVLDSAWGKILVKTLGHLGL
jgi:cation transporter-like permease